MAKKGGKFPGVSTSAYFTTGGFGYFIARNGKGPPGSADWLEPLQNVAEKHSWSKDDLFECYDMDTFGGVPSRSAEEMARASMQRGFAKILP